MTENVVRFSFGIEIAALILSAITAVFCGEISDHFVKRFFCKISDFVFSVDNQSERRCLYSATGENAVMIAEFFRHCYGYVHAEQPVCG